MTHNTSKFQIGGGLESADIGVLVRGVKNENFPCPARLRVLKGVTVDRTIFFALDSHLYFVQELANLTMNVKYSPLLLRGTSNSVLVTRNHKYSSQL